jgi:hypothetical protein
LGENRDLYEPGLTLYEARTVYFQANGFGEDGGYNKKVVHLKLGIFPMVIPNPPSRVEAVKFHDLHHIVSGYQTNWRGEFEISCFEIAAGCGRLWFAWAINLGGVAGGLLFLPRRAVRAWARGRHSGGLYRIPYNQALLDRTVGEVTSSLGLRSPDPEPGPLDWAGLAFTGIAVVLATMTPFAAVWWALM